MMQEVREKNLMNKMKIWKMKSKFKFHYRNDDDDGC